MDLSALGPLAAAVEGAGAPILAAALRAAAPIAGAAVPIPFAGPIVTLLLNSLADAVGGSADDPASITQAINAAPTDVTEAKIQAVENAHQTDLQSLLDFSKLQEDENSSDLLVTASTWREALMRFFFAGWRPAAGWVFIASWVGVLYATWQGTTLNPTFAKYFSDSSTIFMTLIAARASDKIFGVATDSLVAVGKSVQSPVVKAAKKWVGMK